MHKEKLYDINEVCKQMGVTSRTLRFYEEKGIIKSTRPTTSRRRYYSEKQIDEIRNIIVLRSIGLSVNDIKKLIEDQFDLKNTIISRRAEVYAQIEAKTRQADLLCQALETVESGGSLFAPDRQTDNKERLKIAKDCADAIICNNTEKLYSYFGSILLDYMPISVYSVARRDALLPLGDDLTLESIKNDRTRSNVVNAYVRSSKIGLKIKMTFIKNKVEGLFFSYYTNETEE